MKTDSRNIEVPELPELNEALKEAERQWMQTETYALGEAARKRCLMYLEQAKKIDSLSK